MRIRQTNLVFPCLESPTRVHLTSIVLDKRLGVSKNSLSLSLLNARNKDTEWTLLPNPQQEEEQEQQERTFRIHSVQHNCDLVCTSDGTISTRKCTDDKDKDDDVDVDIDNKWILEISSEQDGLYVQMIAVHDPSYMLAHDNDTDAGISSNENDFPFWKMECLTGELCFLSNPTFDQRVRCNLLGSLSMDSSWKGWEVFRFIEVGKGQLIITSWTHSSKVLCSDPDGRVYTTENKQGDWEKWTVHKSLETKGGVLIQSVAHAERWLRYNGESLCTIGEKDAVGNEWQLEPANSNVFFLSCPSVNKRLSCTNKNGDVVTTQDGKDTEAWKLETLPGVGFRFSSCAQENCLLGLTSKGTIKAVPEASSTLWEIETSPNGGYFVTVDGGREEWKLESLETGGYRFYSCKHDLYLGVSSTGNIETMAEIPSGLWEMEPSSNGGYFLTFDGGREEWKFESVASGGFRLYSCTNDNYVGVSMEGTLETMKDVASVLWEIEESPHGGYFFSISSAGNDVQLQCDQGGLLTTSNNVFGLSESWILEPRVPPSKTAGHVAALAGAGAAAVALAATGPLAVMGVVGALGFGAEGIVAGSVGAAMMSAEAVAAGGGVVAGGTVATLQSIGAAGLGLFGTSVAIGGGATAGGIVLGSTAAIVGNNSSTCTAEMSQQLDDDRVDIASCCRPLAAWRSW